jgi:hypothetical protein
MKVALIGSVIVMRLTFQPPRCTDDRPRLNVSPAIGSADVRASNTAGVPIVRTGTTSRLRLCPARGRKYECRRSSSSRVVAVFRSRNSPGGMVSGVRLGPRDHAESFLIREMRKPMAGRTFDVVDVTEILIHWYARRSISKVSTSLGVDRVPPLASSQAASNWARSTVLRTAAPVGEAGSLRIGRPVAVNPTTTSSWPAVLGQAQDLGLLERQREDQRDAGGEERIVNLRRRKKDYPTQVAAIDPERFSPG